MSGCPCEPGGHDGLVCPDPATGVPLCAPEPDPVVPREAVEAAALGIYGTPYGSVAGDSADDWMDEAEAALAAAMATGTLVPVSDQKELVEALRERLLTIQNKAAFGVPRSILCRQVWRMCEDALALIDKDGTDG